MNNTNQMKYSFTQEGDLQIISLIGPFDFIDQDIISKVNREIQQGSIYWCLDFSQTFYIASLGIATVIKIMKLVEKHKGHLIVRGYTDDMKNLLDLVNLSPHIGFL